MTKQHKILILVGFFIAVFFAYTYFNKKDQVEGEPIQIFDVVNSLTRHPTKVYPTRSLLGINGILVHHSGGRNGTAEDHARLHVNDHGWPGIGYHFDIQKSGTILQTNYLDTLSYHSPGQNTSKIGIVLDGNFDQEEPTVEQLKSLTKLISHLRGAFLQTLVVEGHKDHRATACPGQHLYKHLEAFNQA